jgi:short-subunit dehydrogenase
VTDQVVIVTGASQGIGLEVARRFAAAGARVGLIARDEAALSTAAASLGDATFAAPADVADEAAVGRAIVAIEAALGPPAVLVNNAGIGAWGAVVDTPAAEHRRLIEVNYLGTVHVTAAVLPGMLARRHGRIVCVASIAGRIGAPFEAAYSASKFAVVGWAEALAIELAGTGVAVSLVQPGPVDTEFFTRRGHPFALRRPHPIGPGRVADSIVAAATDVRPEAFVPRWLRLAHLAKTATPALYRWSTRRLYAGPRGDLQRRILDNGPSGGASLHQ